MNVGSEVAIQTLRAVRGASYFDPFETLPGWQTTRAEFDKFESGTGAFACKAKRRRKQRARGTRSGVHNDSAIG